MPAGRRPRVRDGASSGPLQYWLAGHPDFAGHDLAFDVVLAASWSWPLYMENAFPV
jgi:hypothetical protein